MPHPSKSSLTLVVLLSLALAAAALAACSSARHEQGPQFTHRRAARGTVVLSGPSAAYVRVEPAGAATGEVTRALVASVTFDERHFASIGPPVSGRIATVHFVTGDHVNRGDVLLTIHSADIAAAQAQVAETRTARLLAEQTAIRTADLERQGAASVAERLQTAAAAQQARDEEHRALASITAIGGGSGAADYALRSPISGTVVERTAAPGSEVNVDQQTSLFRIADLTNIWVVADVYEQDLPLVHVNDPASVEVLAYPGRTFVGRITYVGDVVDPMTRAVHARIELQNPGSLLRPGMYARATLRSAAHGAAYVPISAVLARRDQFFVFVQDPDGSYAQREVHLGEQSGQHTTLLDGLRPGERVVTEGAILLDAEANEAL